MSTSKRLQHRTRLCAQAGLSMVELVLFIVVVGIAVVGVLAVMTQSNKASADPQMRKQAVSIAEGLLEEIQLSHFTYCDPSDPGADSASATAYCSVVEQAGPEAGNERPFDNVNDYVTAFSTEQAFPLTDVNQTAAGELTPNDTSDPTLLQPYTAFLTITPEPLGAGAGAIDANASDPSMMEVLRIRVRVHYASEDIVLDGYRTRYAPNFLP